MVRTARVAIIGNDANRTIRSRVKPNIIQSRLARVKTEYYQVVSLTSLLSRPLPPFLRLRTGTPPHARPSPSPPPRISRTLLLATSIPTRGRRSSSSTANSCLNPLKATHRALHALHSGISLVLRLRTQPFFRRRVLGCG